MSGLNYSDVNFNQKYENYKNGRVILYQGQNFAPYESYVGSKQPQQCFSESINHLHTPTSLTEAYFSRENVDIIQNEIIKRVYNQTNYVISRQSDTNLQIIMRSIYLQYGKNLPCQIKEQVLELNQEVYKECLRIMVPNIQQTVRYRADIGRLPEPMDNPVNLSGKGSKTLSDKIGF
jgi:hypothetical protein